MEKKCENCAFFSRLTRERSSSGEEYLVGFRSCNDEPRIDGTVVAYGNCPPGEFEVREENQPESS